MFKFFKNIVLILLLPFLIFTINYSINSKGYFSNSSTYLNNILDEINKGNNVSIFTNINWKKLLFLRLENFKKEKIDTLVIGSSLSMNLGKLFDLELVNFFLYSASIHDYNLIFDLLIEKNVKINHLIIDVNEYLFFEDGFEKLNKVNFNISLKDQLTKGFRIDELIFNLSMNKIKVLDEGQKSDDFIIFSDGSARQEKDYFIKSKDLSFKKMRLLKRKILLNNNLKNKKINVVEFEKFLNKVKKYCNNISFYITPQPPEIFLEYSSFYENLGKYIEGISQDKIKIIGGFNPKDFEIKLEDFADARHLNIESINKIISH